MPDVRQDVLRNTGELALHRLAQLAAEFGAERIAITARSIAERVSEGRFYVACVGQFKRGKSTLLNALVDQAVLPVGVVPVTAVPTIIRYGECLGARVRFADADWADISVSAVTQYVSEEQNPENAKRIIGLEIFVPSPLLRTGMCLVDTPGLGSVHSGNSQATRDFIPHIDAAIILIGADPPLSGEELELVQSVGREVHNLLFALNKADRANETERSEAVAFARRVLGKRLGRAVPTIFQVSALERLEKRGPQRDWSELVRSLISLVEHSGQSLVREAAKRGLRQTAEQVLAVIHEERNALQRPVEESEHRIAELRKTLEDAERAMRDLSALLTAEQQHLSEIFGQRRKAFLKQAPGNAQEKLSKALPSVRSGRNGPAYRRAVNHLAQEIAQAQLAPWLESEAKYAEDAFRTTVRRFVEMGNNFLLRMADTGVSEPPLLPHELDPEQGLEAQSHFYFHVMERIAAPASPFLLLADLLRGSLGLRKGIIRDARDFLNHLLEVNSARVQSDVDERVRETRRKLEAKIKGLLRETMAVAERALGRAKAIQAAGAPAVETALARLDAVEREVRNLSTG
ncbi:MAG: dynamin family protein [Candidatus Acidiferrales bacterium]